MKWKQRERNRMIFDVPQHIQMAIRLRAIKFGTTTAKVLEAAIASAYPGEISEAKKHMAILEGKK